MGRGLTVGAGVVALALALQCAEAADQCGNLLKSINFEGEDVTGTKAPYTEELAYQDWAPYTFLDGFHGDINTRGFTNERAFKVQDGGSTALEVLLPEGCVTGECAMQAKNSLFLPVESATLKYRVKFGPNFDWVQGGKLPGLCGAECQTGCRQVSGVDGWSSRQMWRPCVWPPESEADAINCSGGKLVAYVYHMDKVNTCGDDFEYSNNVWAREYSTLNQPVVSKNFFQPNPDEWYTVWSHIQMNTAGPPNEPAGETIRDGKLQTWLQVPGEEPLLVVDEQNMGWRVYNNVSIDTLYFSVFFGGSSEAFQAKKDETIVFDDIQVWEGRCAPENEPFSQTVVKPLPEWDAMATYNAPAVLSANAIFDKAALGGGCAKLEIMNTGSEDCDEYQVHLNVRPSWGFLDTRDGQWVVHGVDVIDSNANAGWFLLQSSPSRTIRPGQAVHSAGACIRNREGSRYLPEDLSVHITTTAFCTAGPAANLETQKKITVQDDSATESTAIGLFATRDGDSFDAIDNRLAASTGTNAPNAVSSEAQSSAQSASDDSSSKEGVATAGKWLTVGGTVVLALVAVALAVMLLAPKIKSKKEKSKVKNSEAGILQYDSDTDFISIQGDSGATTSTTSTTCTVKKTDNCAFEPDDHTKPAKATPLEAPKIITVQNKLFEGDETAGMDVFESAFGDEVVMQTPGEVSTRLSRAMPSSTSLSLEF